MPNLRKRARPPSTEEDPAGHVERLALDCRLALGHIRKLLKARSVDVLDSGKYGWGQWLDEPHRIPGQWGRFGSSAGIQVLGTTHRLLGTGTWEAAFAHLNFPMAELFPNPIPPVPARRMHPHETHPGDPDPWKYRDFAEPMKVAFCVDALSPESPGPIPRPHHPLVGHLIGMRLPDEACWTTRPHSDPNHRHYDRVLVTAFCLYALRRFPDCHRDPRVSDAYRWLADELADQPGADVRALCGLALCAASPEIRAETRVRDALRACDRLLLDWTGDNPNPIIERPWSNAYVDGTSTIDYVFLSPETIIALYFVHRGVPGPAEGYIHAVVAALIANINGPGNDNTLRGLRVQDTREGTVDQLWATRLLVAFYDRADRSREQAEVVSRGNALTRTAHRVATDWRLRVLGGTAVVGVVAAGVAAAVFAATLPVTIAAGLLAWFCSKILDAVLDPLVKRLLGRGDHEDEGQ
jgi:hypothetical protein